MALTLNQINNRLRTLALSHDQINSFYFGDPWEFDQSDIAYPACFCELTPGSISRSEHMQRYNVRLYFLDRVLVSTDTEGNETEVLSDMSSVAADFMAMLMYYEDDWEIENTGVLTPVTEAINDMAAGCILEAGINVDFLADRCQVPATDVTFENDFDMARTRILTYTSNGTEDNSFTVTGLAGKIVLAVYRAGFYKRAITTLPTDSDKVQVVGTDLGDRKGILSSTGVVYLQTGDALIDGEILDFIIWE